MAAPDRSDLLNHETAAGPPSSTRVRPRSRKLLRILLLILLVLAAAPLAVLHAGLAASLPRLDGRLEVPGLASAVTISRDPLGIPTLEAADRTALAFGMGFVHGQDRFFQMDLSRRLAAGELSELFGRAALSQDEAARVFQFRAIARKVLEQATPDQRAIVETYARGVNAGLASLRSRPWEYWLLRAEPAPWRPEDSALAAYAMWWDLQYRSIRREMVRHLLNERLGGAQCAHGWKCALTFFYPRGTSWDAPNTAAESPAEVEPIRIPGPDELDVRGSLTSGASSARARAPYSRGRFVSVGDADAMVPVDAPIGSNAWAVSGKLTSTGSALVASDMHLNLRVPIVWYRARMRLTQPQGDGSDEGAPDALDVNGLTLPGAPVVVAGSNGHVAWAFTNSYGDWSDVTLVPCTAVDESTVRTESETLPLSSVRERIRVNGEADAELVVRSGPAGVLFRAEPERRRCWFARWIATVPEATNFNLLALESARTTREVLELAPTIGIPHQNLMVGDREGHIAWTIAGRVPEATAEDRLSGTAPWTTPASHPKLLDPPTGRVWTANARPIDDPALEALIGGDEAPIGADYDLGARAARIRDRLLGIASDAKPEHMLRVQLDDRAVFLTRWRDLLLELLTDEAVANHPQRAELRRIVADWRARASTDSVGYRLVRTFHEQTQHAVWTMLLDALEIDAREAAPPPQFEGALWEVVTQRPMHLLAPSFPDWREFLLAQVDATIAGLGKACPQLARCAWGERAPVRIRHPLSAALPFASRLLDMPTLTLPGDHDVPRVQDGHFGASNRFAVSPGRETEGYLHIAGAQSGHPLSPYYRAGFREWAEGKPLPFLPGRAEHVLTLTPARQ